MRLRAALVVILMVASCAGIAFPTIVAAAPGTSTSAYCTPPNTIQNGPTHPVDATPVQANFVYGAKCPGQPGDIFNDGVVSVNPALQSVSGLNFTIPDNVFFAGGGRVHAASAAFTADASTTDYLYLSDTTDEGTWTKSTSSTPPAGTVLEYTLVTSASAITNETDPAWAGFKINGTLQAGDLTASNQAGHAGSLAMFDVNGKLFWTPAPGCPIAGSNVNVTGTWPSCTIAAVTPTPAPTPCPAAGANMTVTGAYPCTIAAITPTPAPTAYPTPLVTGSPGVAVTISPGPPIQYTVSMNNGPCLGIVAGQEAYTCPTPGPQATPSPTPTFGALITGLFPYTIGLDQSISPTWTGNHIFAPTTTNAQAAVAIEPSPSALPSICPGSVNNTATPPPVSDGLCIGPITGGTAAGTTVSAAVIGKQVGTQWGGTTTSNSGLLTFVSNNGTQDFTTSFYRTGAGTFHMVGSGTYSLDNGALNVGGQLQAESKSNSTTTQSYVPPVFTVAGAAVTATYHGAEFTCVFLSGTTCTSTAWTNASVFVTVDGCTWLTGGSVNAWVTTVSTTQVSMTAASSNSQTAKGVCWGS